MMGEEFVETSDIEELEELEKDARRGSPKPASPHANISPSRNDDYYPRKRMKLFHEDLATNDEGLRFIASPAKFLSATIASPMRSQSSSTMPTNSSPVPFFVSSREPTRTPANDIQGPTPKWEKDTPAGAYTPSEDNSQDPLLLHSPRCLLSQVSPSRSPLASIPLCESQREVNMGTPVRTTAILPEYSTTPLSPHTGPRISPRMQSPDPLSLLGPSPSQTPSLHIDHGSSSPSSRRSYPPVEGDVDELLLFSPTKSMVSLSPLSPLTQCSSPSPRPETAPSSPSHPSSQGLPSPNSRQSSSAHALSTAQADDAQTPAALLALAEQHQESRYSLRQRKPAQLAPYTLDQIQYKRSLRANPEAIVKFKSLGTHGHHHRHPDDHYEEEGESPQDRYNYEDNNDQDAEWEAQERRRRREELRKQAEEGCVSGGRHGSPEMVDMHYPAILQDLPSTDDEDREMDAAAKEARKVLGAKEKQKRAQEKEERRRQREEKTHRPKPYPLAKPKATHSKAAVPSHHPRSPSRHVDVEPQGQEGSPRPKPVTPTFSPIARPAGSTHESQRQSAHSLSPPNEEHIMHDYFAEDDDFDVYDQNDFPHADSAVPGPSQLKSPAQSPAHPSGGILRNTYEDAIEVDSGPDEEVGSGSKRSRRLSESSSSSSDVIIDLPKAKRRVLGRMMPAAMINRLVQKAAAPPATKNDRRSHSPAVSYEDDGPLLPGQTRIRKVAHPKDNRDIRGDSESDEEIQQDSDSGSDSSRSTRRRLPSLPSSDESESDSDAVEILQTYRHRSPRKREAEVIDLVNDDFSDPENSFDDEDIQFFVHSDRSIQRRKTTRMRDQSLIDWMLPRTGNGGGKYKERRRGKSGHSSSYRFDIVTKDSRGYGRERQTLLSFDGHQGRKKKRSRHSETAIRPNGIGPSKPSKMSSKTGDLSFFEDQGHDHVSDRDDYVDAVHEPGKKMSRKEREKARRAQAKKNGVYSFSTGGRGRITNGRRRDAAFFTVDLEDEGFHRALAPISSGQRHDWSKKYDALPPHKKHKLHSKARSDGMPPITYENGSSGGNSQDHQDHAPQVKESNTMNITSDLNIRILHSGKSFAPSSYIRKGRLHELINVVSSVQDPPLPSSSTLCGFDLAPTMSIENFCATLPNLCDSLLEFATGLPDPDFDALLVQWMQIIHLVPQLVSWYLNMPDENNHDRVILRATVEKEVLRLVDQIEKLSLSFIDAPILSTCWFAVDLSSRLQIQSDFVATSGVLTLPLKASSTNLMHLLLQSGIQKTTDLLQGDASLDATSTVHYAAELWVCLIHVLNISPKETTGKSKTRPFWTILTDVLQSQVQELDPIRSFKASEDVWLAIFAMCALSQFSVHGMTTGEPRLPACWDLVAFALKKICLTESVDQLRDLSSPKLVQRDRYVGLVTTRCSHLRERWQWRLDEGSAMFNQLAEIFRSRNFANLRHEKTHLPNFFRSANWDLLSAHDPRDTAFSTFLKLIVQAARDDEKNTGRKSSAKVKKLLSLAVPLGSLPFSKASPPQGRDLTMFYNRLSAVAVAIFLDINEYDDRMKKARSYTTFESADHTTRHAIICALMRLAILLVTREIKLSAILDWIEEISKVLEVELKEFMAHEQTPAPETVEFRKAHPVRLITHLLGSVRLIALPYKNAARYPEAGLLSSLKPVLVSAAAKTDAVKEDLGRLAQAIFDARSAALPKPLRPARLPITVAPAAEEESQESQDFGGIDFDLAEMDWSAADIPAALGDAPNSTPESDPSNSILNDNALREALAATRFKWLVYAHLKPYLQPPPPSVSMKVHADNCDLWLRLWLCCASVETQPNKWTNCLGLLDSLLGNATDEFWTSRVNLSIMFQLLKLDPMAYLAFTDRAMEVFFLALISGSLELENEYISFLLSIDNLQHPLLTNATCLPPRNPSGDFEFSIEQFVELRLPLLQVAFNNLNSSLRHQREGNIDLGLENQKHINFCIKMFSGMRSTRSILLQKAGPESEKLSRYNAFCDQVFQAFQENLELRMEKRFEFWIGWARTLTMPH